MPITRKPKPKPNTKVNVDALISKGGSPAGSNGRNGTEIEQVIIRLPAEALQEIDALVGQRKIKTPRHTWLLEAVHEKIERELRSA